MAQEDTAQEDMAQEDQEQPESSEDAAEDPDTGDGSVHVVGARAVPSGSAQKRPAAEDEGPGSDDVQDLPEGDAGRVSVENDEAGDDEGEEEEEDVEDELEGLDEADAGAEGDEDEAVDIDPPDEDSPWTRHDTALDPELRAALEAAADELEEEEDEEAEAPEVIEPAIPREKLDPEALKVIRRLRRFDHEAYLVGGCVRDLLLGLTPKDFDVATSARPEETREVFSNCRLIGRRFRLAHVYFKGGKVIETATFRANPRRNAESTEGDLYIEADNVYGTAEEDARRRDFTINALFYDPKAGRVVDYVGGLADIEARVIRTVGEPEIRMKEDPVRILRAVRFAAKLDFEIDPATYEAMKRTVSEIPRCAPPRVLEEILRLLRCGASRAAFVLLEDIGALPVLLPPVAERLATGGEEARVRFYALLDALDEWTHSHGGPPDDAVLIAILLLALFPPDALPHSRAEALDAYLRDLVRDARLPRRKVERVRLILGAQRIFAGHRKRRFSVKRFCRQSYIHDALTLFEIRARATGEDAEALPAWRARIEEAGGAAEPSSGEGRRRRGGRRRRRRGGSGGGA